MRVLRFLQRRLRGLRDATLPDVMKERVAFTFTDVEPLKLKVIQSFETSSNTYPALQHHTLEYRNPR